MFGKCLIFYSSLYSVMFGIYQIFLLKLTYSVMLGKCLIFGRKPAYSETFDVCSIFGHQPTYSVTFCVCLIYGLKQLYFVTFGICLIFISSQQILYRLAFGFFTQTNMFYIVWNMLHFTQTKVFSNTRQFKLGCDCYRQYFTSSKLGCGIFRRDRYLVVIILDNADVLRGEPWNAIVSDKSDILQGAPRDVIVINKVDI